MRLLLFIGLLFLCFGVAAQVKISELPTQPTTVKNGWMPVVVGTETRKLDIGKLPKLDSFYVHSDTLFGIKAGQTFAVRLPAGANSWLQAVITANPNLDLSNTIYYNQRSLTFKGDTTFIAGQGDSTTASFTTKFGVISDSATYSGAAATLMNMPVIRSQYTYNSNSFPYKTQAQLYPDKEIHVVLNIIPKDGTQNYPDSAATDVIINNLSSVIDAHFKPYNVYYIAVQNEPFNSSYYALDGSSMRRYAYLLNRIGGLFKRKDLKYYISDGGVTGRPVDYFVLHFLDSTGQTQSYNTYKAARFTPAEQAGVDNWATAGPYKDAIARYREYFSYLKDLDSVDAISLHYPLPINDSTDYDTTTICMAQEAYNFFSGGKEVVFNEVGFRNQSTTIPPKVLTKFNNIGTKYVIFYNGPDTSYTGNNNYLTNITGTTLRPNGTTLKSLSAAIRGVLRNIIEFYKDGTIRLPALPNATSLGTDASGKIIYGTGGGSGGTGSVDLSNYYTKGQTDAAFQPIGSYVPTIRTITINGTTYDMSANRSWTISTGIATIDTGRNNTQIPTGYDLNKVRDSVTALIPTNNNQLTNGSNYITPSALTPYALDANVLHVAGAEAITGVKTFPSSTSGTPSFVIPSGVAYTGTTDGAIWKNSGHFWGYTSGGVTPLDNQVALAGILNQTTPQANASYNIDGTGVIGGASNLTTTLVAGLTVRDTSAATSLATAQNSPLLVLEGQGWKTNATATSQPVKFGIGVTPVSAAANARGTMNWYANTTTAAWQSPFITTPIMSLTESGSLTTSSSITSGGSLTTASGGAIVTQNIFSNNNNLAFWRTNAGDRNVTFFREGNVLIQPGSTHNNGDVLLQVARPTGTTTLGTLTTHAGADTIFSSSALFSLTNNFRVGDTITINGETKTINSIVSSTVMRANSVFANANTNTSNFSYSAVNALSVKANGSVNLDNGKLYTDLNGVYEKFRTMTTDPTTSDIPAGYCQTVWNSTTSTLKRWCNVSGVMHSVTIP